jgi:glycosyltransferase involved in cell wall biosynthesis
MRNSKVGVIIPAFNEAGVIAEVVANIPASINIKKLVYDLVPIVVDDGSTDQTSLKARKGDNSVVITHILNSGAGAATRTGIRYLRDNDFVFGATMDGDGQHDPKDLQKVICAAIEGGADLIVGSRLVNSDGMPWYKILGNKGLNFITKLLLGVKSSDSQSGLKAFNRKTIDLLTYRENGYAFCSEMLWRAHQAKLSIAEVPVRAIYTDYSKAKGQSNWGAFQIIKQLVRHRLSDFVHE